MKNNELSQSVQQLVKFIFIFALFSALLQLAMHQFTYVRNLMLSEIWRWWTGQWVHVGWRHYVLNMLAFLGLPFIFAKIRVHTIAIIMLIFSPLLSLGIYSLLPNVYAYAGLSGVLHGIYIFAALQSLYFSVVNKNVKERQFAILVLVCIGIKISTEYWLGYTETAELIQAPVLIESHQIGCLIGLVGGILFVITQVFKVKSK